MVRPLSDEDLRPLIAMVLEDKGIDLAKYKDKYLRRRISVRLRASGAHNLKHYLKILRQDRREYQNFIDTVTINISNFFRNAPCFDLLANKVLPELAGKINGISYRSPYFLSVGAASGEEAYSLAILCSRFPVFQRDETRSPIMATDIDTSSLEFARKGEYGKRALIGVPVDIMRNYFEKNGQFYRVDGKIKRLVTFVRHDILRDPIPGRFLLVLCRNLLIYLEKEAQERLIIRLAEVIHPGGYLVLGKSEIMIGESRSLFEPVFPEERIYRKIDTSLKSSNKNEVLRRK